MLRFEDLLPKLYSDNYALESYTTDDKHIAEQQQISLLYGEITPIGVRQLGDNARLDFEHSGTFYDLGMGAGKVVLQVYHEYPTVSKIVGIEFSKFRYDIAVNSASIYATMMGYNIVSEDSHTTVTAPNGRQLILHRGSMFSFNVNDADAILVNSNILPLFFKSLGRLLKRTKNLTRIALYNDIPLPFAIKFDTVGDFIETSWDPSGPGYRFNLYEVHHELEADSESTHDE